MDSQNYLKTIARDIRSDLLKMYSLVESTDVLSALAWVDILVYLYWRIAKIGDLTSLKTSSRDRVVFADPSATAALYAVLARRGFFDREWLWLYGSLGSILQGHPAVTIPGVDAPSLDPISALHFGRGMAVELSKHSPQKRVFVLTCLPSDALSQEWVSKSVTNLKQEQTKLSIIINIKNSSESQCVNANTYFQETHELLDGHNFDKIERCWQPGALNKTEILTFNSYVGHGVYLPDEVDNKGPFGLSKADVASALLSLEQIAGDTNV